MKKLHALHANHLQLHFRTLMQPSKSTAMIKLSVTCPWLNVLKNKLVIINDKPSTPICQRCNGSEDPPLDFFCQTPMNITLEIVNTWSTLTVNFQRSMTGASSNEFFT